MNFSLLVQTSAVKNKLSEREIILAFHGAQKNLGNKEALAMLTKSSLAPAGIIAI